MSFVIGEVEDPQRRTREFDWAFPSSVQWHDVRHFQTLFLNHEPDGRFRVVGATDDAKTVEVEVPLYRRNGTAAVSTLALGNDRFTPSAGGQYFADVRRLRAVRLVRLTSATGTVRARLSPEPPPVAPAVTSAQIEIDAATTSQSATFACETDQIAWVHVVVHPTDPTPSSQGLIVESLNKDGVGRHLTLHNVQHLPLGTVSFGVGTFWVDLRGVDRVRLRRRGSSDRFLATAVLLPTEPPVPADLAQFGGFGFEKIEVGEIKTGRFFAIKALADLTFENNVVQFWPGSTTIGEINASDAPLGRDDGLMRGDVLYGPFRRVRLFSGVGLLYRAVQQVVVE